MTSNIGSQYLLKGSTEGGTIAEQARSLVLGEIQVELHLTEEARLLIAERGFDPIYGARPLRRFISRVVENGGGPGPPARQHGGGRNRMNKAIIKCPHCGKPALQRHLAASNVPGSET